MSSLSTILAVTAAGFSSVDSAFPAIQKSSSRDQKFLSLFSIITFPNDECIDDDGLCGTCMSGSDCDAAGGTKSGSCAQGFGACCLIYLDTCGGTVSRNRTYIRNPGYPDPYMEVGICTWKLQKCASNICQIRLDYETFSISQPSQATTDAGDCSLTDRFYGIPVTGANTPLICGENAGQHMYLDAGAYSDSEAELVAFVLGTHQDVWRIKVSMIECGSLSLPPQGCLQYHTGTTGTVRSFNWDAPASMYNHLQDQRYKTCIRQEDGYCKIGWQQSDDPFSFKLARNPGSFNSLTGTNAMACGNPTAANCDYVVIPNGSNGGAMNCVVRGPTPATVPVPTVSEYGGGTLTCITGSSAQSEIISDTFCLGVVFNSYESNSAAVNNRGFCLNYRQIPC